MDKVIITAALTGAITPKGYDVPETPEQIAKDAYEWSIKSSLTYERGCRNGCYGSCKILADNIDIKRKLS